MAEHLRIGIIGAGVAGLAAAWDLARAGHEVHIYEGADSVGGLAAGFKDDGWAWTLEKFYHHWFETDTDMLRLIDELGQRDKVIFRRPKTSYWIDNRIVRSEMNPSMLSLPLSFLSKIRLGMAGVYLKFLTRDWHALERTTADAWMRRWMGEESYQRLWQPLLIGKFSTLYQEVNMAWMWARIKTRTLRLGTFEGGFQVFIETLAAALTQRGVSIHLSTPVEGIGVVNARPALTIGGQQRAFDRVISTTSPGLMLRLAQGLAGTDYGRQVSALKSIGGLCVILALRQSLLTDGTYWLNLPATSADKRQSQFPFLALVEHTNWMDKAHYNGDTLVYCGDYVPPDHEYFKLRDDELAERFMAALPRINPHFQRAWVRRFWVFRAPYAQPLPGVNHSQNIPSLKTPLPGVYWASMSQIYPWDRGTNYAVELGRRVARLAISDLE